MNFGGLNWNSSTGFNSSNKNISTGGGLFGNSTSSNNGNNNSTFGSSGSGLFGNSQTNALNKPNGTSTSGGLFGNLAPSATSGGLFGNQNTQLSASGGLFGNSTNVNKPANTGLGNFTGSNPPQISGSGLFGNSSLNTSAGGGLFGNASQGSQPSSGGLFGNSSAQNKPSLSLFSGGGISSGQSSGGLLGSNSSNNKGLFGNSAGGLFGSSQPNPPTGGLFASTNQASGGGGLFGNLSGAVSNTVNQSASNTDPYKAEGILRSINNTTTQMPASLTGTLFSDDKSGSRNGLSLPHGTSKEEPRKTKSSLLSKLSKTFNIFRSSTSKSILENGNDKLKGVFAQQNYVKPVENIKNSRSGLLVHKPKTKNANTALNGKSIGGVKRLIIKSKPLKYHLINANRVLKSRKKRIQANDLSDTQESVTDDEISDLGSATVAQEKPSKSQHFESAHDEKLVQPSNDETAEEVNDGYWCTPSLKDITQLDQDALIHVDNFIIGRKGHGQIAYNYPVDLSDLVYEAGGSSELLGTLLFGGIFVFESPVVTVYQNVTDKPPIGVGLNVPATITLRLEPKKNRNLEDHIELLKTRTGMEFVTYDPMTYYWTFKVKHFSVWGLIDDSDDEESISAHNLEIRALKKKQDAEEEEASQAYSRIYENDDYKRELKKQRISRQTSGLPGGWDFDATKNDTLLALKQKLLESEIDERVNTYKQEQSANVLASNVSDITIESDTEEGHSDNDVLSGSPRNSLEKQNFDHLKLIVPSWPPNTDVKDIVNEKVFEPNIDEDGFTQIDKIPALPTSDDWLLQLELSNDINSALSPFSVVPKKPQLSLRTINDIVFSDFDNSANLKVSTPLKEQRVLNIELRPQLIDEEFQNIVQVLLVNPQTSVRDNQFPKFDIDPSLCFRDVLRALKKNSDSLELASILFDKVDLSLNEQWKDIEMKPGSVSDRALIYEQKRLLISWLKRTENNVDFPDDPLAEIWSYLIKNELKPAVHKAHGSGYPHLAALLTQLDSNDSIVRDLASHQLDQWKLDHSIQFIPGTIVDIYKLLANKFDEISCDLSFNTSLALRLSYGHPTKKLVDVLQSFTIDARKDDTQGLILVFCALVNDGSDEADKKLSEANLSPKLKWLIFKVLNSSQEGSESLNDHMSTEFENHLEQNKQWNEALFVASTIKDDDLAKALIRRLVINKTKYSTFSDLDIDFCVNVLRVPPCLIQEAVALKKNSEGDFWGKGDALIAAQLWNDAHENIVEELGPETVIKSDFATWARLLKMIDSFPDDGRIIPSWQRGAGLFRNYFEICQKTDHLEAVEEQQLREALENLALFPTNESSTARVASTFMAKHLVDAAFDHIKDKAFIESKVESIDIGENERLYFRSRLRSMN